MRPASSQSGFTLIEIMVVVFILGLLAAMVVPNVIGSSDKARVQRAKADIRAIEEAVNLFKLENGFYPQSMEVLVGPSKSNPDGYLKKVPKDPWDREYAYRTDGRRFVIKSLGADGTDGGDGFNADIDSDSL